MRMQQAMGVASFLVLSLLVCSCMGAIPRRPVAVQGYVFCTYCKLDPKTKFYILETDLLPGARVKLACNNRKKGWEEETTTDKEGSFMFRPSWKKLTTWGAHKCKVFLEDPSPRQDCIYIDNSNIHSGLYGDSLRPAPNKTTSSSQLFTVGPFAFNPDYYACLS